MEHYERYQRHLRRRRLMWAGLAWLLLIASAFFAVVGLWFVLALVISVLA